MTEQQVDEKIELKVTDDEPLPPPAVPAEIPKPAPKDTPFDPRQPSAYREWKKKQRANRPKREWRLTPITVMLILIGGLISAMAFSAGNQLVRGIALYDRLLNHSTVADGVVTNVRPSHKWYGSRFLITFKSADGKEHETRTWTSELKNHAPDFQVGDHVPVHYLPDMPDYGFVEGAKTYLPDARILLNVFSMFATFALSGIALFAAGMERFTRADRAKNNMSSGIHRASRVAQYASYGGFVVLGAIGAVSTMLMYHGMTYLPTVLLDLVIMSIGAYSLFRLRKRRD